MADNAFICYPGAVRRIAAFACLFACLPAAAAESSWPQTLTPHFDVHHQDVWLPPGFVMNIERIHSRLAMDLAAFSPWMANERIGLYLYANARQYAAGELGPPAWSNGLAVYQRRLVAVYDQRPQSKLLQIVAHETTHLLFESYWGEAGKRPPAWLNEGLAMLEETDANHPEDSRWYPGMKDWAVEFAPFSKFVKISPARDMADSPSNDVALWYAEAYSVVYFLVRKHSRLQFETFNGHLRDGDSLQRALWESYGYVSLRAFESAWRQWLGVSAPRRRGGLVGKRFGAIDGLPPLR